MKKLILSILIGLTLILSACGALSTSTPMGSTSNDLPVATELAVGTLQLAGTGQEISVEQAQELLVYWQVYKEISQSETSAQAEVDGLVAQIQETMTTDQMQAITDMEISQQDVMASMQGVAVVSSDSSESTINASTNSGMPAGGPPGDGAAPPDGGGMPSDVVGAAPASSVDTSRNAQAGAGLEGSAGVPSLLIDAVIQSLLQKIAA